MAITALATQNTTVGPAQFADMVSVLQAPFVVDGPNDLKPTVGSNGTVTVAAGSAHAGGTRIHSTTAVNVTVPVPTSGGLWYAIVVRINWATGTPTVAVVPGTSSTILLNTAGGYQNARVNRIPGVAYDALVAVAYMSAGSATPSVMHDMRMYGGDGGPLVVSQSGLTNASLLDARVGTWITTPDAKYTKRKGDDGTWNDVGSNANPWKLWTPTLRYYEAQGPNGTSGGTSVFLGTNGSYSGRYRVVDGLLDGFVQITTGAGANFGSGSITMDLPLPCAAWQADTWSTGHIYTDTTHGGDGNFDWVSQALVKAGWTRALLFAPVSGDFGDLKVHRAVAPGEGNGSGYPVILGGKSIGTVYTYNITYPVQ
jgi:hypothetical protein